ncbi:hypothetical protein ACLOJK_041917 [Asimina triloba]
MNLTRLHLSAPYTPKSLIPPFPLKNLNPTLSSRFVASRYSVENCVNKEKAASEAISKVTKVLESSFRTRYL